MEQRFKETSKQDNPHLLRVGAFKIYCERKQTATAVFFFYGAAFREMLAFRRTGETKQPVLVTGWCVKDLLRT